MTRFRRVFSMAIVLVLLVCAVFSVCATPVSAASTTGFDILTTTKYAKTYTLATIGKTVPYTSKYLSTRGTVTYGASSSSYIANSSDELYVMDVGCTNGKYWAYVSYPTSSRRVNAYIPLSALTENNGNHAKTTSSGKFYCSYRKGYTASSSYYVDKGDTVYLVATSGNQYQILYPISGGKWRLAWCSKSNYDTYCKAKSATTKTDTAYKQQTTTVQVTKNDVVYKYITMSVDTSSLDNWKKSMSRNTTYAYSYWLNGIVADIEVKSYKTVTWYVPASVLYPSSDKNKTVKVTYTVPSVVRYKVHTHTKNSGFGKSWYYSGGCIKTLYTCNCGYRKELLSWEIPLPDVSGGQTAQSITQWLPQIN